MHVRTMRSERKKEEELLSWKTDIRERRGGQDDCWIHVMSGKTMQSFITNRWISGLSRGLHYASLFFFSSSRICFAVLLFLLLHWIERKRFPSVNVWQTSVSGKLFPPNPPAVSLSFIRDEQNPSPSSSCLKIYGKETLIFPNRQLMEDHDYCLPVMHLLCLTGFRVWLDHQMREEEH